jgi:hypothetical protein
VLMCKETEVGYLTRTEDLKSRSPSGVVLAQGASLYYLTHIENLRLRGRNDVALVEMLVMYAESE